MKKVLKSLLFPLLAVSMLGCDLISGLVNGTAGDAKSYDKECASSTGKWFFLDENKEATDSYFEFDGSKGAMKFNYYEDGTKKLNGTYRVVVSADSNEERSYVFMWCLDKKDGEKEDVIYCYADNFSIDAGKGFTQFTILKAEKKLPMVDGYMYSHIYRLSETPYKLGTYVLEGNAFIEEKNEYLYKDRTQVEPGTYVLNENVSLTLFMTKPYVNALFSYKNGDEVVEGIYWTTENKDRLYFYINHDQYDKVTKADQKIYDTTFNTYYPPEIILSGNFKVTSDNPKITISDISIDERTPFSDGLWVLGTYLKK